MVRDVVLESISQLILDLLLVRAYLRSKRSGCRGHERDLSYQFLKETDKNGN